MISKNLSIKFIIFIVAFFVSHSAYAQAGRDDHTIPTGVLDPNFKIIRVVENKINSKKLFILTQIENQGDSVECGGFNEFSCFIFLDGQLIENLIIDHSNPLDIESIRFMSEQVIVFDSAFASGRGGSISIGCFNLEWEVKAIVYSTNFELGDDELEQTDFTNLNNDCGKFIDGCANIGRYRYLVNVIFLPNQPFYHREADCLLQSVIK